MPIGPNGEQLPYPGDPGVGAGGAGMVPQAPAVSPPPQPTTPSEHGVTWTAIIDAIQALAEEDGFTEQERLTVEKIRTLIQQLSSDREKEQEAMAGVGPPQRAMQRAYGAS